jgi:hypothetical protein
MTEPGRPGRLSTFEVFYYLAAFVAVVTGFWYLVFFV